jgi:aldehyde:ferredoxin oxidoreductase
LTPFLYAATGFEEFKDSEEILNIGERVNNLVRCFNLREGLTRADDTLPERFFEEPLKEDPCRDRVVDLGQLLEEYYFVRGWDENGEPTKEKLEELGLPEF